MVTGGEYIATGTEGGNVFIWSPETGEREKIMYGNSKQVTDLSWSPDGKTIAGTAYGAVKFWDVELESLSSTYWDNNVFPVDVEWSADGGS